MKFRSTGLALSIVLLATPFTAWAARSTGEKIDDSLLVSSTKTALLRVAPNVASAINVDVHGGRILLVGFMDSDKQKADALAAAAKVKGGTEVIDGLVVMPGTRGFGTTVDDQMLQTKVKGVISQVEGWDKGMSVNTECKNGEILLGGFVAKASHMEAAGKAAATVTGVKKVHNFLTVKQPPVVADSTTPAAGAASAAAAQPEPAVTTTPVP